MQEKVKLKGRIDEQVRARKESVMFNLAHQQNPKINNDKRKQKALKLTC
jgi:hypothetical protein